MLRISVRIVSSPVCFPFLPLLVDPSFWSIFSSGDFTHLLPSPVPGFPVFIASPLDSLLRVKESRPPLMVFHYTQHVDLT